jgi:hypothetical protein
MYKNPTIRKLYILDFLKNLMKRGVKCAHCGEVVKSVCANCWRCEKCCDCKNKTERRIDGVIEGEKRNSLS